MNTTMTADHKAAIAAGRVESSAVNAYLETLDANRPKPGRKKTPESLNGKLARINGALVDATAIKKLRLLQERRDVQAEIEALADEPDTEAVEAAFVKHAASYGQRKGIQYATWREQGVPADVLRRAGVTRGA